MIFGSFMMSATGKWKSWTPKLYFDCRFCASQSVSIFWSSGSFLRDVNLSFSTAMYREKLAMRFLSSWWDVGS